MIWMPKFTMPMSTLNALWSALRRTAIGQTMTHRAQAPVAMDLARQSAQPWALPLAKELFGLELRGAGSGWESRRALEPVSNAAIATTAANNVRFNIYDYMEILHIGFVWTVAGTVTAMAMDFDLYDAPFAGTLKTDKLDGVRGFIQAPSVASQAIGRILTKDIGDLGAINVNPGQSISANVTTTTTAGNGMPFVLVVPRAETFINLGTSIYVKSN